MAVALLTAQELADALQVNKSLVYALAKKKDFPHLRVGRHLRFDYKKVLKYLERQNEERKA